MPINDCIHHYPRALFNDIPKVGAYFYNIPGSGRSLTTYPGHRKRNKHLGDGIETLSTRIWLNNKPLLLHNIYRVDGELDIIIIIIIV